MLNLENLVGKNVTVYMGGETNPSARAHGVLELNPHPRGFRFRLRFRAPHITVDHWDECSVWGNDVVVPGPLFVGFKFNV